MLLSEWGKGVPRKSFTNWDYEQERRREQASAKRRRRSVQDIIPLPTDKFQMDRRSHGVGEGINQK